MTKHHPAASARVVTGAGTAIAFIVMVTGFHVSATLANNEAVAKESMLSVIEPVPAPAPAAPAPAAPAPAAPAPAAPAPAPAAPAPAAPAPDASTAGSGG